MMSKLARCPLAVSATSVASEQMFSSSGEMSKGTKSSIGKDLLECMVFLYCNATKDDVVAVMAKHVKAIRKELRKKRQDAAMESIIRERVA